MSGRVYTLAEMQTKWAEAAQREADADPARMLEDACALLCEVEWRGGGGQSDAEYCACCGARNDWPTDIEHRWHVDGCKLDLFLKRAGWR